MATFNQILCSNLSAFLPQLHLIGDLAKSANDFLVAMCKCEYHVWNSNIVAELFHVLLRPTQVVPREAREQMMHNLEIETAMHEVQPRRAINIHSRPYHLLGK